MTNPPAELVWTDEQGLYLTEHDYTVWALAAHSVHRGKSGWSSTDEWHLHRAYPDPDNVGWTAGTLPLDHGRWIAGPGRRNLARAKRIAAWIIANPGAADRMMHHEIVQAAGEEA
ncbi:hypothetical protein CFP71_39530 [Amycolatopsis thailandensis]|uniref:Uncharacterized protein n=1 Tax=Amycolatopsis thailandensis TaxID=589330 RepID=A0A229REU4_9PSEU|nr:hypothetical protein [Amycolatopsis thailandensis]OXM44944.1 hypothetical protein CFP71_39530 [Amycolatopsis thailandensis]